MDQVTQQNAAMVEESTAASHHLAQEAGKLEELVSQFQTGAADTRATEADNLVGLRGRSPAKSAPRPMLKTVGTGRSAAVRKPDAAAERDWEEF